MKQSQDPLPLSQLPDYSWSDNELFQWLLNYGRYILMAVIGLFILFFGLYRSGLAGGRTAEIDYLNAEYEFSVFSKPLSSEIDPAIAQDAFSQLRAIMLKHPELQPKYDGPLAQLLLDRGEASLALPYAKNAIERTSAENRPFYAEYAQNSLLIGEKNYSAALAASKDLHQKLAEAFAENSSQKASYNDTLFAFNLLRIAMLQQELGLSHEEIQSWQEWKRYVAERSNKELEKSFTQVHHLFDEGKMSLLDYIAARERQLSNLVQ